MHLIEPHYNWQKYYIAAEDECSPFYGAEYSELYFTHTVYGYYIHPQWDFCGSETLYLKILYANYQKGACIIELIGEWNDALHNDIMHFKRNVIDRLLKQNITKFVLIGENLLNFHGGDDDYYAEWFEDLEDGWVVAMMFRDHVIQEWEQFGLDEFFNYGGHLEVENWRTFNPAALTEIIDYIMKRRLTA